jgi:peptidoglycan/LPS O-acetylase OafA/YrhL
MNSNMPRTSSIETGDKILGVELLRFASAIAVLIFHFQHFAFVGITQPDFARADQPFYPILKLFYEYGFYGVQVFWCISGFIFYWKYSSQIATHKISGYAFFILRLSRLYPLHFITLLFVAAAQIVYFRLMQSDFVYSHNDSYHFLLQLFMASNWGLQQGDSFNGPIWSISIEVLVYLTFFISLRLLSASPFSLAAIVTPAAVVIALKLSSHPFFYCVLFFYAGCYTALIYGKVRQSIAWRRLAAPIAIAAIVIMPTLVATIKLRPLDFLLVFAPALVFLCVLYVNPSGRSARLLTDAGNITYASYLLHVPLQISVCIIYVSQQITVPWRNPLFFLLYMTVTLLLSHGCYKAYEMPMQKWMRRRFLPRNA